MNSKEALDQLRIKTCGHCIPEEYEETVCYVPECMDIISKDLMELYELREKIANGTLVEINNK